MGFITLPHPLPFKEPGEQHLFKTFADIGFHEVDMVLVAADFQLLLESCTGDVRYSSLIS
jgi:hypothetical protein